MIYSHTLSKNLKRGGKVYVFQGSIRQNERLCRH